VLAALTFASLAVPVARAASAAEIVAFTIAAVFAAIFVAGTMSVHAVIARTRRPPAWRARIAAVLVAIGSVVALWLLGRLELVSNLSFAAAVPTCLAATVVALAVRSAVRLRAVGWTFIATTVLASALLFVAFG